MDAKLKILRCRQIHNAQCGFLLTVDCWWGGGGRGEGAEGGRGDSRGGFGFHTVGSNTHCGLLERGKGEWLSADLVSPLRVPTRTACSRGGKGRGQGWAGPLSVLTVVDFLCVASLSVVTSGSVSIRQQSHFTIQYFYDNIITGAAEYSFVTHFLPNIFRHFSLQQLAACKRFHCTMKGLSFSLIDNQHIVFLLLPIQPKSAKCEFGPNPPSPLSASLAQIRQHSSSASLPKIHQFVTCSVSTSLHILCSHINLIKGRVN
jgi:hypothetical protein